MTIDKKDLKAHTPSYEASKIVRELLPFVLLGWAGIVGAVVSVGLVIAVAAGVVK